MADDIKCPICGSVTILRTAKKGHNAGKKYNVCNRYPECKGQVPFKPKHSGVSLFGRKHKPSLSELQGVPEGTFRCDVCKFVQPVVCLCGAIIDRNDEEGNSCLLGDQIPKKTQTILYELCGTCAIWLGFKMTRFPQGVCIGLKDEQRVKINALHNELEINKIILEKVLALKPGDFESLHDLISQIPNLNELLRLRWSMLPKKIKDISDKLTRGEHVEPSEISLYLKRH